MTREAHVGHVFDRRARDALRNTGSRLLDGARERLLEPRQALAIVRWRFFRAAIVAGDDSSLRKKHRICKAPGIEGNWEAGVLGFEARRQDGWTLPGLSSRRAVWTPPQK